MSEIGPVPRQRLGPRLLTRGGLAFALVLLPGLRFGWRGLGVALVAGGLGAATVLAQRAAVARARRGLSPAKAAAAASVVSGLLGIAAVVQMAVLLAAPGAGPEAQLESVAGLLGASGEALAARAVTLLAAGVVLGGAVGAATLAWLEGPEPGGASMRWLLRGVGIATGLLVAGVVVGALRMDPFDPALPLLFLVVALIAPLGCTLVIVVPMALLEGALAELVSGVLGEG